ncbi:MAG: serine hydrolase [Bacteroidota bacterium]
MSTRVYVRFLFLILLVCPLFIARSQQSPVRGLDEYIAKSMKQWDTPGLAIAIVKDDQVIFAKGYGMRKLGESALVDEETIFACASTSKAMSVACLGMLVDEGKLKWDDPVEKYLPGFQLFDPYVTRELTVRDLLTHRSGLGRGDLLWYQSPYSREEILRRVRSLKPSSSFRSRYGYQNIMYMAAGEIVKSISGKTWDEFIKERLFTPLGMTSSSTSVKDLAKATNVAAHHVEIDNEMVPIEWPNYDNVGAAGAINSSVLDLAQWVRLNLAWGTYNGKQILSTAVIKEMQTPQTVIRLDSLNTVIRPSTHFSMYGLGWNLRDYLGHKIVMHTGVLDGMRARVSLIPELGVGFAILMNSPNESLHEAIAYRLFDYYLGGPERDWSSELLKVITDEKEKSKVDRKKKADERKKDTQPSLALDNYAGSYEHEMYGPATVAFEDGKLVLRFYPKYVGEMRHWNYDTFEVVWNDRNLGKEMVTFVLDSGGKVGSLRWEDVGEFRKKH